MPPSPPATPHSTFGHAHGVAIPPPPSTHTQTLIFHDNQKWKILENKQKRNCNNRTLISNFFKPHKKAKQKHNMHSMLGQEQIIAPSLDQKMISLSNSTKIKKHNTVRDRKHRQMQTNCNCLVMRRGVDNLKEEGTPAEIN